MTRSLRVQPSADVLELLTASPLGLDEHDFELKVNGQPQPWQNNADRASLQKWVASFGRGRPREDESAALSDRLAYWWDLSAYRGQNVTLELSLRGRRERNEIAWRGLSVRSAIGNLPESGQPLVPEVPLTSLPLAGPLPRDARPALKDAIPAAGNRSGLPMRFLGQRFTVGYGMPRNCTLKFDLEPEFRKFVAVVGCSYEVIGPLQLLIDDKVVWERPVLTSLTPAEQIEIEIPAGAKTLTLQTGPDGHRYGGVAAWANAGFTK
jgi:hypothetical protein